MSSYWCNSSCNSDGSFSHLFFFSISESSTWIENHLATVGGVVCFNALSIWSGETNLIGPVVAPLSTFLFLLILNSIHSLLKSHNIGPSSASHCIPSTISQPPKGISLMSAWNSFPCMFHCNYVQMPVLVIFVPSATITIKGLVWWIVHPVHLATTGLRKLWVLPESIRIVIAFRLMFLRTVIVWWVVAHARALRETTGSSVFSASSASSSFSSIVS